MYSECNVGKMILSVHPSITCLYCQNEVWQISTKSVHVKWQ